MNWPITITQDKCALDCLSLWISSANVGFMDPSTGPWSNIGYWWKWGCAPCDPMLLKLMENQSWLLVRQSN